MKSLSEAVNKKLPVVYDHLRGKFLMSSEDGTWTVAPHMRVRSALKLAGFATKAGKGEVLSELDAELMRIWEEETVEGVMPLAGYPAGVVETPDGKLLCPKGANPVEPVEGEWPLLRELTDNMLGEEQCEYLFQWWAVAIKTLRKGETTPGPALALCGAPGCGKSLLQNLIAKSLGGRTAKPYQYMTDRTSFNAEMGSSECWIIDDENGHTDRASRREFGNHIKQMCASAQTRIHAKGKDGFVFPTYRRLIITLNDEPEDLMVLPFLDEGIVDKLIILKARNGVGDRPRELGYVGYAERLQGELGGFLYWLLNEFAPKNPKVLGDATRFGVSAYIHPDVKEVLTEDGIDRDMLELVDACLFHDKSDLQEWEGSAAELTALLTGGDSPVAFQARQMLKWPGACGPYLRKCIGTGRVTRLPGRKSTEKGAVRAWKITRGAPEK